MAITSLYILIEEVRPRVFPKRFGEVVENEIFRSGRIHPDVYGSVLNDKGIDLIISFSEKKPNHDWQLHEIEIAKELDIPIYRFPLKGDDWKPSRIPKALVRLKQEETPEKKYFFTALPAQTEQVGRSFYTEQFLKEFRITKLSLR